MGAPLKSLLRPQFGIESGGYGVNAAATRLFLNIEDWTLTPEQEKTASGTQGLKYNTRRNLYKETSKVSVKAFFDYIDCGYFFSSIEGLPTEGAYSPGGAPVAGVYQHVWESSAYNADTIQSYTGEFPGSVGDRVQKVNGLVFDGYKIGTESAKKLSIDFTGYAKAIQDAVAGVPITASTGQNAVLTATIAGAPTSMNIVFVYDNQQSSVVAYTNATTAAAIQTAIRTLAPWATATVAGAAGGPFTITNPTGLAMQPLLYILSAQVGGPGTLTIAQTTAGGMKTNPSYEVMPGDISIGWATTLAGLDNAETTPVNQYKTDIEVGGRHKPIFRQNPTDVGIAYIVESKPDEQKQMLTAMLAYTSEVAAFIAASRAVGGGMYFRVAFTGLQIGATGVNRSLTFDFFCNIQWKAADGDYDNIRTCEFDMEPLFDVNGVFIRRITAINELASYATA